MEPITEITLNCYDFFSLAKIAFPIHFSRNIAPIWYDTCTLYLKIWCRIPIVDCRIIIITRHYILYKLYYYIASTISLQRFLIPVTIHFVVLLYLSKPCLIRLRHKYVNNGGLLDRCSGIIILFYPSPFTETKNKTK